MSDQAVTTLSLLAFGLVLVAVEVFVVPGFGVIGIAGAGALLLSATLSFVWFGVAPGMGALLVAVLGPLLLVFLFAKSRAGKQLVLSTQLPDADGTNAKVTVGQEGRALSPLHPAGTALFGEERVDVVTDGTYVEADSPLRVVEVSGARVVVEKINAVSEDPERTT